ncbi:MAG: hypothetical protein FJ117_10495 [Deltaproteobacteria bacterium]|nr:hypothetical protein [Deltaproteobacteria bacterium]
MDEKLDNGPKIKGVRRGQHSAIVIGSVQVFVGPENMAPYPVEAWAAEEDTYLVLSADPEVQAIEENPEQIMAEVSATHPAEPGSVIVKNGYPLRLLAIIHDLNQEPSWKEEWVASALDGILQEMENREIRSLALPLLGTLHGSLERKRFLTLLREALERRQPIHLSRLWLVVPSGTTSDILAMLEGELQKW